LNLLPASRLLCRLEIILAQGSQVRHAAVPIYWDFLRGPPLLCTLTELFMSSSPAAPANEALVPVSPERRVFQWHDHASLWFSLGVGLLVMQVGAYLMPALGTKEALIAIICGSIVGAGLLGWVAKLGADSGLASAGLMHAVYGRTFASLPIILNIVQLVGWGTFELVVMRDATVAIGRQSGAFAGVQWPVLATLLWGGVVMLLISGSMVQLVRKVIARVALPLVVLSLLWLTWQFLSLAQAQGFDSLWNRQGAGGMGVFSALDLVIAMPISWLPLVADYARHGRSGGAALRGTWLGYALANMWCYSLGVLVALTLPSKDLVQALLLAQGGLIALSLILIDEVDNAYGDTYSGAVSAHSLLPGWGVRKWGLAVAAVCTGLALVLPMHSLEPFLLLLSSVFVPLFGVILGRLAFGTNAPALLEQARKINAVPVAIWLAGIAFYHLLPMVSTLLGASLPTLALCFLLAFATHPRR
jgi:putative hydroxymethylpyrimidine transporter CytX